MLLDPIILFFCFLGEGRMGSVSGSNIVSLYITENSKLKARVYVVDPHPEYVVGALDPLILDLAWPLLTDEKPKVYYSALIESEDGIRHIFKCGKVLRLQKKPRPLISLPDYLKLFFILYVAKRRNVEKDILEVFCDCDCNISFLWDGFDKYSHFYFVPFHKYIPKQYLLDYLFSYLIVKNYSKDILSVLYEFLFCAKWQFPMNLFSWGFLSQCAKNLEPLSTDSKKS